MSTTGPFDTGYIGAHRWHVEGQNSYRWTCVCGDTGNVAGNLAFLQEAFGRHAHEKLEKAAVSLVLENLPRTRHADDKLLRRAKWLQEAGDRDRGNILMLAANQRHHERQEDLADQYRSLEWTPWPYEIEGVEGSGSLGAEVDGAYENFWLYVCPLQDGYWAWETWKVNPQTGDETRLAQGTRPNRADAQLEAWSALHKHLDEQEEDEPF
jgi:hypothetical protein